MSRRSNPIFDILHSISHAVREGLASHFVRDGFDRYRNSSTPKVSFSQPGVERGSASDTPGRRCIEYSTPKVSFTVISSERHLRCRNPDTHLPGVSGEAPSTPGWKNDTFGVENQFGKQYLPPTKVIHWLVDFGFGSYFPSIVRRMKSICSV
jgi:hypothetical protein